MLLLVGCSVPVTPPAMVPPLEVVGTTPLATLPTADSSLAGRLAALAASWPDATVVRCPLEGRFVGHAMPVRVSLDRADEPPPLDYGVAEDTLFLAVPAGSGAANLRTADGGGTGRFSWPAGATVTCEHFRWTEGPVLLAGRVLPVPVGGARMDACGTGHPVALDGTFSVSLPRSALPCVLTVTAPGSPSLAVEVPRDRNQPDLVLRWAGAAR